MCPELKAQWKLVRWAGEWVVWAEEALPAKEQRGHGPGAPGNERNMRVRRQKIRLQTSVGAGEPQKGEWPFLGGQGKLAVGRIEEQAISEEPGEAS